MAEAAQNNVQPFNMMDFCRETFTRIDFGPPRASTLNLQKVKAGNSFYDSLKKDKKKKTSLANNSEDPQLPATTSVMSSSDPALASASRASTSDDQDYVPEVSVSHIEHKTGGRLRPQAKRRSVPEGVSEDEEVSTPKRPRVAQPDNSEKKKAPKATPKAKKQKGDLQSPAELPRELIFIEKSSFMLYKEREAEEAKKSEEAKKLEGMTPEIAETGPRRTSRASAANKKYTNEGSLGIVPKEPRIIVEISRSIDDAGNQEQFMFLLDLKAKIAA